MSTDNGGTSDKPPQLHIFDAAAHETDIGNLMSNNEVWALYVILERTSAELYHGRISFRCDDERYDTDAIVLGETEAAVIESASELPASMLHQILDSLRT